MLIELAKTGRVMMPRRCTTFPTSRPVMHAPCAAVVLPALSLVAYLVCFCSALLPRSSALFICSFVFSVHLPARFDLAICLVNALCSLSLSLWTTRQVSAPYSNPDTLRFSPYWINLRRGILTVGSGLPGQNVLLTYSDDAPFNNLCHVGLSTWSEHASYRDISLGPPLELQDSEGISP